jgi:D-alanyl-D-alanine carboxypeptidase
MKTKKLLTGLIIIIALCFMLGGLTDKRHEAITDYGWELILVNDDNFMPEDYKINLLTLSNGQQVDERIYPHLQEMFDDMRKQGHRPIVVSGYRSEDEQKAILKDKIKAFEADGYSGFRAEKLALQWVAQPGTSEHQLGLAVDINPDYTVTKGWGFYAWLEENSYKYGFVKRYPADKTDITGISNENWHFRYVGLDAAKVMYEENLCLEEYIENCFMQE